MKLIALLLITCSAQAQIWKCTKQFKPYYIPGDYEVWNLVSDSLALKKPPTDTLILHDTVYLPRKDYDSLLTARLIDAVKDKIITTDMVRDTTPYVTVSFPQSDSVAFGDGSLSTIYWRGDGTWWVPEKEKPHKKHIKQKSSPYGWISLNSMSVGAEYKPTHLKQNKTRQPEDINHYITRVLNHYYGVGMYKAPAIKKLVARLKGDLDKCKNE